MPIDRVRFSIFSEWYPAPAPDKERYDGYEKKTYKREIEDEYIKHVSTYANECCGWQQPAGAARRASGHQRVAPESELNLCGFE